MLNCLLTNCIFDMNLYVLSFITDLCTACLCLFSSSESACDEATLYLACLLRLPDLGLPNANFLSVSIWDFSLLTPCCVSCVSEENTVYVYMCLYCYVHITLICTVSVHAYIHTWCTLAGYIFYTYWLHYVQ